MNLATLEDLDDLDKRIVVALQHDGRASWRAVAEAVDGSVTTVSRRGQQLIADGVVRVAAVPALGADGPSDSFWVRINCATGTQVQVAAALAANPDVRFCTIVTGGYDVILELVVRGGAAHHARVLQEVQSVPGVERWRSDLILHVYKVSFDWGRQLYRELLGPPAEGDEAEAAEPVTCAPEHFDDADRQIIAALRDDGRRTFQSIADEVGMNESSVRRRFERLRASQCISLLTLVPSAALGMSSEALMTVKVAPSRIDAVAHELARYPFVRYLAAMLDENSLLCEIITPTVEELYAFITGSLARLDGVEGWNASLEVLYLKRGFVETPWWRAQASEIAAG
ncbi:Lrp/AsnC family transcriptional regulator [Promicromonospora sp. MEB111]|uniref:Lrp/AsnC family transcriptional regulator n=1 Tax=Promicromonospora sp. MEB111 TaxID=3040301 RepID=UPI00254C7F3E|nr:Lrp/AsnC family transcriptional regulator [Promicromonospora sp. MEB111]